MEPAVIWQWTTQAIQRVDISATVGQVTPVTLLMKNDANDFGVGRPKRVSVHTSNAREVFLTSSDEGKGNAFVISSNTIYELKLQVKPRGAGLRSYQVHVVDQELQRVTQAWILSTTVREPDVSKIFSLQLPTVGSLATSAVSLNKRIAYTNPYPRSLRLTLDTDKPHLLSFKDKELYVDAGETTQLGLRFNPPAETSEENIYVFLLDEQGKSEETLIVKAKFV
ncbi:Nephrocystin-4 [Cichlidogyrus casuarinus]|uniref:Nephrocystin-4 n=1 Tax=Cichlidogyrus casuarinus TaxID=1844966 RepID=A0ABD2PUA5_9PLAT